MIGPPTLNEYAVEPVGVAITSPSALSIQISTVDRSADADHRRTVPLEHRNFVEGIRRFLEISVIADKLQYTSFLHTVSACLNLFESHLHLFG